MGLFGLSGLLSWSSLFGSFKELKRPDELEKPDKLKMGCLGLLSYLSAAVLQFKSVAVYSADSVKCFIGLLRDGYR